MRRWLENPRITEARVGRGLRGHIVRLSHLREKKSKATPMNRLADGPPATSDSGTAPYPTVPRQIFNTSRETLISRTLVFLFLATVRFHVDDTAKGPYYREVTSSYVNAYEKSENSPWQSHASAETMPDHGNRTKLKYQTNSY